MRLKRVKQCAKCPWKVDTNPNDIPNGYDTEKHKNLSTTIADPDGLMGLTVPAQMTGHSLLSLPGDLKDSSAHESVAESV